MQYESGRHGDGDGVASRGLDFVLNEQASHEQSIAQVMAGSASGRLYFIKFVTKTIYKALLALQH